ncbi:MAG: TIGR01459 family HAD-type hydrolase [Granulosicoccus sp.]
MKRVDGLEQLVNDFDVFLIDQYGVLHNGVTPYPYAIDALQRLKSLNKGVVILSNSGKRASTNMRRMEGFGFTRDTYDCFVSSGEVAFDYLQSRVNESERVPCFVIHRGDDLSFLDQLNLYSVDEPAQSELILLSGCEPEKFSEEDYKKLLHEAAAGNVDCLCTNPDKKMLTPDGLMFSAGRVAEIYEELGGTVQWMGKPFSAVYKFALRGYAACDKHRVLCIGDSVEHDIAGGCAAGLRTMLVETGIVSGQDERQMDEQFRQHDAVPTYVAAQFRF